MNALSGKSIRGGKYIKVLHLITDLHIGGAEMMLYKLMSVMNRKQFQCRILTLESNGALRQPIKDLGVQVDSLHVNPHFPSPLALLKASKVMREWKPHVIQTWMYHADLLGTLAWLSFKAGVLMWNIRCTNMDFSRYSRMTHWVMKICAVLSRAPQMVVANSNAAIVYHRQLGYHQKRSVVIPNGFDLNRFRPDPVLRIRMRKTFHIPKTAPCVGLMARFDPMKDHAAFFSAAAMIEKRRPDVHFVLCGEGVTRANAGVAALLNRMPNPYSFHLLGRRKDIPMIAAGLDLLVLTSRYGESFPNVIGEAMACGVPCVVTDVGDTALIVGETGLVVPPGDPSAMADAVLEFLDSPPEMQQAMGLAARKRIKAEYSLKKIAQEYERLYRSVAGQTAV